MLSGLRVRLRALFRKAEVERELDEELRFHLEKETEQNLARGMSPEEARRAALVSFGGVERVKEESRDVRGFRFFEELWQDLRFGARMLLKKPGFTSTAVLTLALGIGANTAIFSLVNEVLLKMLPVRHPEQLVLLDWSTGGQFIFASMSGSITQDPETGLHIGSSFSYPAFEQFRSQTQTLSDVFAFAPLPQLNVNEGGQAEIASGQLVSGDFYTGLGVQPVVGRVIGPDDDREAADPVAVLSYHYWRSRFGLDPDVVGKIISVNGVPFNIIGVTPAQFYGGLEVGSSPDLSLPMMTGPRINPSPTRRSEAKESWSWWVQVMGRLKPGVSAEAVRAELEGVFQQSALEGWQAVPPARRPPDYGPRELPGLRVTSGGRGLAYLREGYERPLRLMLIVVGLVLLIACANIANLLLTRASARRQEIAVRLALGASRLRLIRQLLTESVLLAVMGAALGWLLAWWAKDLLLMWRPSGSGQLQAHLEMDWRVFAFTAAVALLTGILFGLAPALSATRVELTPVLKENARGARGSLSRFGKSLVVAQVAVSLLLLAGAGLFIRTLYNLHSVELGFNPENLLLFKIDPRLKGYKGEEVGRLYEQMIERFEAVPGVRSATLSEYALLTNSGRMGPAYVEGRAPLSPAENNVYQQRARWNYFEVMEIPLLAGRGLTPQDDGRAPKVAVINQTMARVYFGGENPVGRRFGFGPEKSGEIEVVGVVRDAKYQEPRQESPSVAYIPYTQESLGQTTFALRTAGDPRQSVEVVREAVREVDKDLPVFAVKTQVELADEALGQERLFAWLTGVFGLLALLLASIGLYGVMSYAVAERTHEIGLRMALGASQGHILRKVIGQGTLLTIIGIAIGLAASLALTRFITSYLFGVSAMDPPTFVAIVGLLAVIALVACYLPARRASKIDPMTALRYE
ncbi:MAG TPA: ABC transporter permease [Pyrinomonadaceae bacterium]|jgi:predicted permease|nr:ABC transporter permease [Pyrinomonadaceae bacterium]